MKPVKPLSKGVLAKMIASEHKKLETLEDKSTKLRDDMLKIQWAASDAMMKEEDSGRVGKHSAAVQRMINKGFKAEFFAFKAGDALRSYKESMKSKYA